MTLFLLIPLLVVLYLSVLAAWVSFWAHRNGVKGNLPYRQRPSDHWGEKSMTGEEVWASFGVIWPLMIPAGIVAIPVFGAYFLVAAFIKLFGRVQDKALDAEFRRRSLKEIH